MMRWPFSDMRSQFILVAGDDGVFFTAPGIKDAPPPFFAASNSTKAETTIREALAQNPSARLTIFADTLAQDVRQETLPKLNVIDRAKLMRRRLQQSFPQGKLSAYLKLGRTKVLLAGLHHDSPVLPWLERLAPHNPAVALLPVECAGIAVQLTPEAPQDWILMYCRTRTGGFRQIVTHKGEIVFTRLTPNLSMNAKAEDVAEVAARDIRASLGYLARLGLEDSRALRVVALMPDKFHAAFAGVRLPVHSLRLLSPCDAAGKLDLPFMADPEDACCDLLFAGWLSPRGKPRLSLVSPKTSETRHTELIRKAGMRGGITAMAISVLLTGWQTSGLVTAIYDNHQQSVQLEQLKQRLTRAQATAAPITEPLGRLRIAIERQRIFSAPAAMPWALLRGVAHGLGNEARAVKLEWFDIPKSTDGIMHADVRLTQNPPTLSSDRQETATRYQKLADGVSRAMPGFDVRVTRFPFPALPQEALTNTDADKDRHESTTAELSMKRSAP